MKYILSFFLFMACFDFIRADGMEFHHGTWAEALAKSKETGKPIFMDAFTTWCGPCKMMSAKTFPQKEVGDFYNANFINVKMDMEKGEGMMLAGTYSVSAYPTLLFIDGEGKLIQRVVGYMEPGRFIAAGKDALKKNDKSDLYAKEYASGKRDFKTIYNYVKALNQAGKPSLKFANEYINTQKDLTTPDNLKFLFEAATEADSRIFDLMLKQKDKLTTLYGAEEVQSRIIAAANKTVKKAIEYKTNELLIVAQERVLTSIPAQSNSFNFESNLAYYAGITDAEGLLKSMKKNNADIEKNILNMNTLATVVESTFPADSKLLSLAEQGLSKAMSSTNQDPSHLFMLARILALNKKMDKADKMIDEAIVQAKSRNMDAMPMQQFKLQLAKG